MNEPSIMAPGLRRPTVAVVGYLSLDSLKLADGRSIESPGGAALYAALGVLAAGGAPRIYARLGQDFPPAIVEAMAQMGIDTTGLLPIDAPSRRAVLAYADGDRRRSRHHGDPGWWQQTERLAPPIPALPAAAYVLCPMPAGHLARMFEARAIANGMTVVDTSEAYVKREAAEILTAIERATVFAPSVSESRLLHVGIDDDAALERLTQHSPLIVQKRGPEGLVMARRGRPLIRMPARASPAVETTGAGDAGDGALAVGLVLALDDRTMLELVADVAAKAVSGIASTGLGLRI